MAKHKLHKTDIYHELLHKMSYPVILLKVCDKHHLSRINS